MAKSRDFWAHRQLNPFHRKQQKQRDEARRKEKQELKEQRVFQKKADKFRQKYSPGVTYMINEMQSYTINHTVGLDWFGTGTINVPLISNKSKKGTSKPMATIGYRDPYGNQGISPFQQFYTSSGGVPNRGELVFVNIPGNQYHGMKGIVRDVRSSVTNLNNDVVLELQNGQMFVCPSGQVTNNPNHLGQLAQSMSQQAQQAAPQPKPKQPRPSAKRRTNPDTIRFIDLEVGDKLTHPNGRNITITYHEGGRVGFTDKDGGTGTFSNLTPTLKEYDWTFIAPPKKVTFDDVILPEEHKQLIFDAITQVDNYDLIFNKWGFGDVLEKGKAVSMLFYGPPGTGKTMIAQAIADKYDYKLKFISTAEIESSEPGQAERNIKAFFEGAQKDGKTLLLFDECDSLIADRRAVGMILGAQINALLTCLEQFEGIAIFTTNRLEKMDEAFNRRLSLKLKFEMPDLSARVKIWQRLFPKKAPLADDIRWEDIAKVEVSGGYIKNVALRAARRAANTKEQVITHDIIVDALIEEVERMSEFDEAVNSSPLPRLVSGGYGKSAHMTKVMETNQ